jgi:hypothetical protein
MTKKETGMKLSNLMFPFMLSCFGLFRYVGLQRIIQLDLFDSRLYLPDIHVGRSEVRLSHLEGLPPAFTSWYEIWHKLKAPSNVSEIGRRYIYSDNIGAIQIEIKYHFQNLLSPPHASMEDLRPKIEKLPEILKETESLNEPEPSLDAFDSVEPTLRSIMNTLTSNETPNGNNEDEQETKQNEEDFAEDEEFIEDVDEESKVHVSTSLLHHIGNFLLSKETMAVLNGIRHLTVAYNQGLEVSNTSLFISILLLENYYIYRPT